MHGARSTVKHESHRAAQVMQSNANLHTADTSMSRNCPCLNCLLHNFIGLVKLLYVFLKYASVFNKGGMHPIPSTVEAASVMMSSTISLDDSSLPDLYHFLPRPSPCHAEKVFEGGSKNAYSKDSPTNETSKMILEKELSYADSDDEDIFLTCLDVYTPENPMIIYQVFSPFPA
ncbi:hypothetical protein Bca4012_099230 [Brassica carinata]|uniref:Uncharacterized protein n=2 Tax=Brassica oleracea TaxID=3712 RepID=A0A0D2ZQE3_BRAOL|nr:unnamed protein product [Brassica oleracea]